MNIKRKRFNIGFISNKDILKNCNISNAFTEEELLYAIKEIESSGIKDGIYIMDEYNKTTDMFYVLGRSGDKLMILTYNKRNKTFNKCDIGEDFEYEYKSQVKLF